MGRHDANHTVVIVKHRDRVLGVISQIVDTVTDILLCIHIGKGCHNQILQLFVLSGNDQIVQTQCAVKSSVFVYHIHRGNVVVIRRLLHQRLHGLLDG